MNHWIIGAIGLLGSCAILAYFVRKNKKNTYSEYQTECIKQAQKQLLVSNEIKKTILVLEKVSEDTIAAFFYRSYTDGKIRKEEIRSTRYSLGSCPQNIIESILANNCIIKTY